MAPILRTSPLRRLGSALASSRAALARASTLFLWPCLPLAAGLLVWLAVDREIGREQRAFQQGMSADAQSIAAGYAQFLSRSIDQIDQLTLQLKYGSEQGRLRLRELAARGIFGSPQYVDVAIVDARGTPVDSSAAVPANASHAARPYFAWHRANISSALRISPLEHDADAGRPVIRFTRRLDGPDDDFDGVVVVTVASGYFSGYYDAGTLGARGLLAVAGDDGMLRASRAGSQDALPDAALLARVPRFDGAGMPDGFAANGERLLGPDWFADGDRRFVAWRTLPAYPLTVMAGVWENERRAPLEQRWAAWRQMRLAGEAALVLLSALLWWAGRVADRRRRRAVSVQAAYRLATEAGEEGFYMLHPLRRGGRIVDFRVLDCNERGAALFGKDKSTLLGQTISQNYRPDDFGQLLDSYCHAMERGSFREEDRFHPLGADVPRWVRRKVVRSGGELAVTLRDISDAKAQESELIRLANTDELTGLPNRSWFIRRLDATLADAGQRGDALALLFIDLDKFKNVNDTLGHSTGDAVLQEAACRLRQALRPDDHVARLGGDEFTLVLHRIAGQDDALRVADRIRQAMSHPFPAGESMMEVGATIGIALYPRDGGDAETLLKHADIAMYAAKGERRGSHAFYQPEFHEVLRQRIATERELAEAIERDEFELHYQPRVDACSGRLLSLEALVRWRHPRRGMVPPGEFIPVAENTGQIIALGALVIDRACRQLALWRAAGLDVVPVSVNVSAMQFRHGDVHDHLARAVSVAGIPAELIEIEITESAMLGDLDLIRERLAAIRALGIRIAVDDFGTGYSSLSQLQRLDVDVLKVDRVFTADLDHRPESQVLFRAIVSMAHALDMRVVAEGVETVPQAAILRDLRCDELQGYLVARPLPAADAADTIRRAASESARGERRGLYRIA
ncbi:bifunctional diguanylate cyclase/phosphodiesterase [Noviherbaspirillum galbum]|uniref:EAL domain-containing protein n=1 Tax=Noviherbaspirillum galbum TaxID=2709383 RepID=A0A6B3SVF4_9BURK|nr:EAL domain-containing protein [Noviherbaspirillum galbum]NEX64614.1 EAL domain-containing protein [Noviherbaspirillum galbum]